MRSKRWIGVAAVMAGALATGYIAAREWQARETVWADPADVALVRDGRQVYQSQCASCHGANLEGERNWRKRRPDGTLPSPPHDATGHTWHHADKVLFDITKFGGQRSAPPGFVSRMPAFGEILSDRQIHAVLAYIKSLWPEPIRQRQELVNSRGR